MEAGWGGWDYRWCSDCSSMNYNRRIQVCECGLGWLSLGSFCLPPVTWWWVGAQLGDCADVAMIMNQTDLVTQCVSPCDPDDTDLLTKCVSPRDLDDTDIHTHSLTHSFVCLWPPANGGCDNGHQHLQFLSSSPQHDRRSAGLGYRSPHLQSHQNQWSSETGGCSISENIIIWKWKRCYSFLTDFTV